MSVKSLDEFVKVVAGIVGPWGGLRVVLNSENWQLSVPHPFYCTIIEVNVRYLKLLGT